MKFSQVLLTTPSISTHDAVSNDVWIMQEILINAGYSTAVYAELANPEIRKKCIGLSHARSMLSDPNTLWIHHHSVFWAQFDQLSSGSLAVAVMRYHNITPSHFYERYQDYNAEIATRRGIDQTKKMIFSRKFSAFLSASQFNANELMALGVEATQSFVLAPMNRWEDFNSAKIDAAVDEACDDRNVNVLFVGRVVPNKGHVHLLRVLDRFMEQCHTDVRLHIAGSLQSTTLPYLKELQSLVKKYRLGGNVKMWGSTSFDALHTLYAKAQVFLCMSEHEGFCVPIVEAQLHGLPVLALDRAAVLDTLGPEQLCFPEPDYDRFAAAIHYIHKNFPARQYLQENGRKNAQRFHIDTLRQDFLHCLSGWESRFIG